MGFSKNGYLPLIPPIPLHYDSWSKKQADEYLMWFTSNVPERAKYILNFAGYATCDEPFCNHSSEVLFYIWKWLLSVACIEQVPKSILDKQKVEWALFGNSFVSDIRLDILTEYVLRDIAMLVSYIFTLNYDGLYWGYDTKAKNYAFRNHPVLKGFLDTRYKKPFQAVFEPVHMVGVQASKILKHTAKETDLLCMYNYWANLIPK